MPPTQTTLRTLITITIAAMCCAFIAAPARADVLGEWSFNTGATSAQRLASSNTADGVLLSSLSLNDSFDDFGVGVVPNNDNDGFGFGGNSGQQTIFLHRANYFDGSAPPGQWTSWGSGASAGTGADLSSDGNAPVVYTVTADANHIVRVDNLFVDTTAGAATIFQTQGAGAAAGPSITLRGTGNPTFGNVNYAAPIFLLPGQTKTFTVSLNSGNVNSNVVINQVLVNGVSTSKVFGDPVNATLGPDPESDVNIDVPARQTGIITGNWTASSGSGGAPATNTQAIVNSQSLLDGNAFRLRTAYNLNRDDVGTIGRSDLLSTDVAFGVVGQKYEVSAKMVFDDSAGTNPLEANGLDSFRGRLAVMDQPGVPGGLENLGLIVQFETLDATTWTYEVFNQQSSNGATSLLSGALAGFDFGTVVDVSLVIDERDAQDTARLVLSYGATTIDTGEFDVSFANQTTRQLLLSERLFVQAAYANTPDLIVDAQYDNIMVTLVPAPTALPAGLTILGLMAARRRR